MDKEKLNKYIENYFKNDKTKSAIMLEGDWGTGKSYYIENELIPYLEKEDIEYIIISLYGITDLKDISKEVYVQSKFGKPKEQKEGKVAIRLAGKTIFRSLMNFINVDVDQKDEDLQTLYESIDLKNKLIIFDDLERSRVGIINVLGYINNLVDQDKLKALVICNEKEIDKTEEYNKKKEKTISQTIHYSYEKKQVIKDVLNNYKGEYYDYFIKNNIIDYIEDIMSTDGVHENIRSIISACQKFQDLTILISFKMDYDFANQIFKDICSYCILKLSKGETDWISDNNDDTMYYGKLYFAIKKYLYDYIINKEINEKMLKEENDNFVKIKEEKAIDSNIRNSLNIIYGYYKYDEPTVVDAINKVLISLETTEEIKIEEYGELAMTLIYLKTILDCDETIEKCKELMINNINDCKTELKTIEVYKYLGIADEEANKKFIEFQQKMNNLIKTKIKQSRRTSLFEYNKEHLSENCKKIINKKDEFLNDRVFGEYIDFEKLLNLLKTCNAIEIQEIRSVFREIYNFEGVKAFYYNDYKLLYNFKNSIECYINKNKIDAIYKLQLKWLIETLDEICMKLK